MSPQEAERFAADLARLWPEGGRLGLAVSGGPDSLALLLLAQAAIPGRFAVATVNHGLRPEAAGECAMVERVCGERGIPCVTLAVKTGAGNLQAAARAARYAALAEWAGREGLSAIATAHHADDQAETLLMRLNRASGLAGLAGVRARGVLPEGKLPLLRPLLRWRRAELAAVVTEAG
ncbi:MAG TPA: tRNA lysidine(34) synthetase TilS, partial [Kofleriaceae bacterium]|nr:tRNA lysidine(34) synthetase TilS [Kofleriaceae bacterium]